MATPTGGYNLNRDAVATSTAISIAQVATPSTSVAEIVRGMVNQSSVTATNQTRWQLNLNSSASTVTSQAASKMDNNMQAAKAVNGTSATGITATAEGTLSATLYVAGFNVVNGDFYLPVPEERAMIAPSLFVVQKFPSAPASANYTSLLGFLEY